MVFVKVYANGELRRMQLEGPISYEDLKQKVANLFPSLRDGKTDFGLQYTDADEDSIVISSDEEIQAALDHLPPDHVWRIQVVPVRSQQVRRARPSYRIRTMAPFGSFGGLGPWYGRDLFGDMQTDPFWSPMGLFSLGDTQTRHSEWEELMRQKEEQMDQEMQRLKKMQEDHMRQFEEQRKKAEEDIQESIKRQGSQPAVPSKPGESSVAQSGKPGWHCQTFGSWEPVSYESPHGKRTVVGPVGYHMYWGYSDPQESMETDKTEESKRTEGEATNQSES